MRVKASLTAVKIPGKQKTGWRRGNGHYHPRYWPCREGQQKGEPNIKVLLRVLGGTRGSRDQLVLKGDACSYERGIRKTKDGVELQSVKRVLCVQNGHVFTEHRAC